jgi:hypothetical protein
MKGSEWMGRLLHRCAGIVKYITIPLLVLALSARGVSAAPTSVMSEIDSVKLILAQVGPALSAVLFVIAGIFYAIGQLLPPDKKANFHTAAINIIIGAVVVGALSVASTSLAIASTHLISNLTIVNSSA